MSRSYFDAFGDWLPGSRPADGFERLSAMLARPRRFRSVVGEDTRSARRRFLISTGPFQLRVPAQLGGRASVRAGVTIALVAPRRPRRIHEIRWPLASRFWSAASISACWAATARRGAVLAGPSPSHAVAATVESFAPREARTPNSTGSIRRGCVQPPTGDFDGVARGKLRAAQEAPPGVVRRRNNGAAMRGPYDRDQPREHVASSPGRC
jgi:hypothetical protein